MPKIITVKVNESYSELKQVQKRYPSKTQLIAMLILLKEKADLPGRLLSLQTGASTKSVQVWRSLYIKGGIDLLLQDKRGGYKQAAITEKIKQKLQERLTNPKEGFRSFIEVQQWLENNFGIKMKYQAVNKYVKRKFGARLKVSRKSHVLKRPADEAVFKNPISKIRTY